MNKQEVINCNDGQALADEVAVKFFKGRQISNGRFWMDSDSINGSPYDMGAYDPHLPSISGKALCFDLAQKCDLELDFVLNVARYDDKENELTYEVNDENMQIAILKACLLSQLGEGDE